MCIQMLFSFFSVCKTMEISPGNSPFLCMDLTYITFLLQELGFPKSQSFKVKLQVDFWGEWAGGCRGRSHPARSLVLDLPSCLQNVVCNHGCSNTLPTVVITVCHNLQHCIHLACFRFSQRIVLTFLLFFLSSLPGKLTMLKRAGRWEPLSITSTHSTDCSTSAPRK